MNWNLSFFYKNKTDPRIDKDLAEFKRACERFEKKYKKGKSWLASDEKLKKALDEYEKLTTDLAFTKPIMYLNYLTALDTGDAQAAGRLNLAETQVSKELNRIIFFELELGKLSAERKKAVLKSGKLSKYRYFLERLFERSKHRLSEAEEKIMNLKAQPAHSLWVQGGEKVLYKQSISFEGKKIPVPEAMSKISSLPYKKRHALHGALMRALKGIADYHEQEINAVYLNKKLDDELRGFEKPYSQTVLSYENGEPSVERLVAAVTKANRLSHRFYKLKAKLLGRKKLGYADRAAGIGKIKRKFSFGECVDIVRGAYASAGGEYEAVIDSMLKEGRVDAYPKPGKTGGAFCSSAENQPTFVLLNHTDDYRSLMTIAHEMGHAVHSELSKCQTPIYQSYTMPVAEVASTFFEQIVFDHIFDELSPSEKRIALHDRVNDSVATIFRQVACFNFELELHGRIRETGALSKEKIAELMNKHMKDYLGPVFDLKEEDGYYFVPWSHLRRFFYVYSYAYGELTSRALYQNFKRDPSYMEKIKAFLSAGGSKSPEAIFKDAGIDITSPEFFEEGLKSVEEDIKRLERIST